LPVKKPVYIKTKLGQEKFRKWAIKYIEPYLLPPHEKRTWNDYYVDTAYGPLGITIRGANVFMRFTQHPPPPRETGMTINPYTGKYNLHLMHDWSVDLCKEQFEAHLEPAMLVPPNKTIGSLMLVFQKYKVDPAAIGLMLAGGWIRPELTHMVISRRAITHERHQDS